MINQEKAKKLNELLKDKHPVEIVSFFNHQYKGNIALSSSLGAEDQVLTNIVSSMDKSIRIFTLDTGRLFPETYALIENTNAHYDIKIEVYFPDKQKVEEMVKQKGVNLFYRSIENRKLCCAIRKTDSLKRALEGVEIWLTGIRKDQSVTRFYNQVVEWDSENHLIKVNPLLNWTYHDVWDYIKKHDIPYNPLHDKGYKSIGCLPCTKPVKHDQDERAGRWWWEEPENKECGIHNRPQKHS